MKVLITGGSSLIGRHTAALLVERGDVVVSLQRTHSDALSPMVEQRRGDITDRECVDDAVRDVDAVLHLAAKVGVLGGRDDYVAINVGGTRNLLEAARHAGVHRFVHVSSPSVAHDGSALVGVGADPAVSAHGRAWYPETKALAERLALEANDSVMGVVVVRPHLVWGPGDTQLVGRIVERAAKNRLAIVNGGRALVDTTYIDNAATAFVAAIDAIAPGSRCAGRPYVISNGEPRPVRELVEGICRAAGVEFAPRDVPLAVARRVGSVVERAWPLLPVSDEPPLTRFLADQLGTAHWFDPRPARADLGWSATVSIDDGLRRLSEWFASGRAGHPSR